MIDVRHQVLYGTPTPLADMRSEPLPPRSNKSLTKPCRKSRKTVIKKSSDMRDDLKQVLQEVSGVVMEGGTYAPRHLDHANPVKRAWNWITGKTGGGEGSSQGRSSSAPNPISYAPEITMTATGTEKKSVAILPFKNLSGDKASNFYEFALADAIITELAQLRSLIMRPSSVIAKYQGADVDSREAGKELRVNAVLSAGFMRSGDRMRVTAQLLEVATGEILWSDRVDAQSADIFALQDIIAQKIVDGLKLELSDREQEKLGRRPTENIEAWEEFLRGRDNFGRFIFRTLAPEDCEAAIQNFKRAIELDTHFALAYSGLGACYANRVIKGLGEAEDYTYAEAAFSKAFKYDPNVVEARVLMIMIYLSRGEKSKARAEISQLQELFPNEAPLYFVKGMMSRLDGEYEDSLNSFAKLSRLDPVARVVSAYNRSRIFVYQGEYDKAIAELDKGAKAEPNHPLIRLFRSQALFYRGDVQEAIDLIEGVLSENPQMNGIRPILSFYLGSIGKEEEARAQLTEDTLALSKADHDMAYWVGTAYATLGDKDLAFKWLERAVRLGNENKPWYLNNKCLDSLRDDPRFNELLQKIDAENPNLH